MAWKVDIYTRQCCKNYINTLNKYEYGNRGWGGGTDNIHELWVRPTFTMNGIGMTTTTFITVTYVNE